MKFSLLLPLALIFVSQVHSENSTIENNGVRDKRQWFWPGPPEETTPTFVLYKATTQKPKPQKPTNNQNSKLTDPCAIVEPVKPNFSKPGRRISEESKFKTFLISAAIGWQTIFGGWTFKCGATIISPRFLVTAAHCTKSKPHRILQNTVPEIVRLGVVNLKHFPNNDAVDVNISRIMKYPKYKSPRKYFDIALLELQEEVKFGAAIQPACLWSKSSTKELGKRVVASGWGITNVDKRSPSSLLRTVNLLMINEELCEHLLKPFANRHWSKLADHQLCAGELAGGLDACQGDSGGPLQVQMDNNQHKMYYLIGVTSFGYSCGLPNVPGLYTRVASFIDWIEDNVWKEDIDRLSRNTSTLISKPIR
ncbi:serine protease Hayan-like [Aricia agestis]|uniref:serine protease Hayan-like n=1 Tax=Aricia agestis TaxID=91739 RepID=UPI001C207884|nr:serine protease Hayan-like [Aricia agestis]